MNSLVIWWQALKPQHKTLLQVIGGAMVLIAAVYLVVEIPYRQAAPLKAKIQRERDRLDPPERLQLENDARTALIQGLGGVALLIGLWFTWRSIRVTERNLQITQDTTAKNLAMAQEGQITERFNRAVEQLGSTQLEVRLGAIYTLERIARDSERDHLPIMEILTTYVKERAPYRGAENPLLAAPPAIDIKAVLTVLERWNRAYEPRGHMLDLGRTNLYGVTLLQEHLERVSFHGACLEKALLFGTHFERANFTGACLREADLSFTHLEGAQFVATNLEKATLMNAHLEEAHWSGACLEGANLRGAFLERATGLTLEQLAQVKTLYQAHLDPPLLEQIQQHYSHLLEEPKDERGAHTPPDPEV